MTARATPIRNGFRALGRMPALVPAEIAWRWTWGGAVLALAFFAAWFFLDSVAVSPADALLLGSGVPPVIARAITRIFAGSGGKLLRAAAILAPAVIVLWTLAATAGRAFALKTFRPECAVSWRTLLGLSFLRAMAHTAGFVALLGTSMMYARLARPPAPALPRPALGALLFIVLMSITATGWWLTNAFLSALPAFAVRHRATGDVFSAALGDFCRQPRPWFSIATVFGVFHLLLFSGWFVFAPWLASVAAVVNGWLMLVVVVGSSLAYFAAVDALHIARFAAQVSIAEHNTGPAAD